MQRYIGLNWFGWSRKKLFFNIDYGTRMMKTDIP